MLTARKYMKRLALSALVCGVLFMCAVGGWLLAGQRPYPRHVQFRAPHRGTLAAMIDAIWFGPNRPRIFEFLPESWIPVVYAQQCTTPICNYLVATQSESQCPPSCGSGFYDQFCEPTVNNSYCTQTDALCTGGYHCFRASNSKCNPPK